MKYMNLRRKTTTTKHATNSVREIDEKKKMIEILKLKIKAKLYLGTDHGFFSNC